VSAPSLPTYTTLRSETQKEKDGVLINTKVARPVNRQLVTGAHVVADISCMVCNAVLGWKYVDAKELAQRYKIGKFILETRRVVGGKMWEDVEGPHKDWDGEEQATTKGEEDNEDVVVFDSEDEDECEDLFAGVWDAEVVKKRRGRRVGRSKKAEY
jgi:hypothetical protein